jgi:hypothetical protein
MARLMLSQVPSMIEGLKIVEEEEAEQLDSPR